MVAETLEHFVAVCPLHAGRRAEWGAALPAEVSRGGARAPQWLQAAVDLSVEQQGGARGRRATLEFLRAAWEARAAMAEELREAAVLANVVVGSPGAAAVARGASAA